MLQLLLMDMVGVEAPEAVEVTAAVVMDGVDVIVARLRKQRLRPPLLRKIVSCFLHTCRYLFVWDCLYDTLL